MVRGCCVGDSGTLEDTELVDGLVFDQKTAGAGGTKRVEKAKIGLIQFCISPPKTDVRLCENCIVVVSGGTETVQVTPLRSIPVSSP